MIKYNYIIIKLDLFLWFYLGASALIIGVFLKYQGIRILEILLRWLRLV